MRARNLSQPMPPSCALIFSEDAPSFFRRLGASQGSDFSPERPLQMPPRNLGGPWPFPLAWTKLDYRRLRYWKKQREKLLQYKMRY